ncbi:lipase family protein [Pseudanabaena sp. FACHB-1998]|uniref:lipase family protein n=1 Tax=Pseudanabaena sp. FACHB-1998 TaxID=2692858 RepID=UPI001680207E|nr:lipase family protein [Pseudanabaena sp. FACHB-1998]MBD2175958.1 lipase family protein [Pseudanabaena sp. FACHB-1998]
MPELSKYFTPEFSTTNNYSPKDAIALASACALAYAYSPKDGQVYWEKDGNQYSQPFDQASWGFTNFQFFNKNLGVSIDTQGFVAEKEENLIIAFRGSESTTDWLTNIKLVTDPGPLLNSRVHEGFQDALYPVVISIISAIYQFDPNRTKNIWITGHSLGGALAVLMTAMLSIEKVNVRGLYTFGAPRVGNKNFANLLEANFQGTHFRVVNQGDLVPHVPFEAQGFYHAGKRIIFDINGDRLKGDTDEKWNKLKEQNEKESILNEVVYDVRNFKDFFAAWFKLIPQKELAVKEYHVLLSKDGYLARLKKDLGLE